jgi:outer membrane protein
MGSLPLRGGSLSQRFEVIPAARGVFVMRCLRGLLLGLVILLLPASAGAAEAGPVLDLPKLIALALKYSPQVKASQSEVQVAQEQKNEAHSYRFPQIDTLALGGLVPNARLPQITGNPPRETYSDPKDKIHGVNVFGHLDLFITQPLYTFGKIAYREEAASRNIKVKEAGVDARKGEVIFNVAQAYYGLILANEGKQAVQDARSYLSDTRKRIDRLLAINSPNVKESDRYRLEMYEGAVEKFAAQSSEGAKVAYQALKALIGYGPGQDFQVPAELPNPAAAPAGLDHYIRQALELRPELAQLKEGLAARELLVEAAKADQYPSFFFAIIGSFAGAPGRRHYLNPFVQDYFNDNGALPVLGMKWHWDFGILKAKIGQARAEFQQLKHTQQTALMGIPVEVGEAYGKVQENYKASAGLEKSYVSARRWLITAFSNFDFGIAKLDDIFQAFEKYGAFRGDYLLALYEYNLAQAKLNRATGAYLINVPKAQTPPGKKPGAATPAKG